MIPTPILYELAKNGVSKGRQRFPVNDYMRCAFKEATSLRWGSTSEAVSKIVRRPKSCHDVKAHHNFETPSSCAPCKIYPPKVVAE